MTTHLAAFAARPHKPRHRRRPAWIIILVIAAVFTHGALAQPSLSLIGTHFAGGPGDQSGRAISISRADNAIYLGGATGEVVRYSIPPTTPTWSTRIQGGSYTGLTTVGSNLYGVGSAVPPVCGAADGVGGTEPKSMLSRFSMPGGTLMDCRSATMFPYSGYEGSSGVVALGPALYVSGTGETCGFGNNSGVLSKFDSSGNLLQKVAEPGVDFNGFSCTGASENDAIAVINGNIFLGGHSKFEDGQYRPVLQKYGPDLVRQWKVRPTDNPGGVFLGVAGFDGAIYAAGYVGINTQTDFVIAKFDEAGNRIWSRVSGGPADDVLYGIVGLGSKLYAVGFTKSQGAGGSDAVILEVDPATGATLSTTLYGGGSDEVAYGVSTDGTDLYVVGDSRSFASAQGNMSGHNDIMLLHYAVQAQPNVSVSPTQGLNTGLVTVTLSGSAVLNGAQVKLSATGLPDIPGSVFSFSLSVLTATFNLAGTAAGSRDLVITSGGASFTIASAFTVVSASSCLYSVAPGSQAFPAVGGGANFVVTATPSQCSWNASSNVSWITLNPGLIPHVCTQSGCAGSPVVSFTVAGNTAPLKRAGSISAGSAMFTVTQDAAATCTYVINPTSQTTGSTGGIITVIVTSPAGCAWTVQNAPSWITVKSGGSGSGNGSVVLSVAGNSGGQRFANLTIASKTFSVNQSAVTGVAACGALDVSGLVSVTKGALQIGFLGNYYTQTVTVRNNSSQTIAGPIDLIMDGLPRSCTVPGRTQPTTCGPYPANLTHCGSTSGSAWLTVTGGGLASGGAATVSVTMYPGSASSSNFNYSTRVFSGNPNQ